jgi:hypothetical protein
MKRLLALGACLLVLVPAVSSAQESAYFWGPHPNHPAAGGGFCYSAGSHVHPYGVDPNISYLYRNYNNHNHFAGNVYEFGYQREAYPYYGHHPLGDAVGHHCYLDGQHYHATLPLSTFGSSYVVHNGNYYYNGAFPVGYHTYRSHYYRSALSYRYLPAYRGYYNSYGTSYRNYARPAALGYIYNNPRGYGYGRAGGYVGTGYARPGYARPGYARPGYVGNTYAAPRVYRNVTNTAPAYRYNTYRPGNYGSYYNRPAAVQRTTSTTYRPSVGATRTTTTTTRSWRR